MKNIVVIAPAQLPIPPTRGGAVENLVNLWIEENERKKRINLTIISPFDIEAKEISIQYKNTQFIWYKSRGFIANIRNRVYRHLVCPIMHYSFYNDNQAKIIKLLKQGNYDKIILESNSEFVNILGDMFGKDKIIFHTHIRPQVLYDGIYSNCCAVFSVSEYIKSEIVNNTDTSEEKIFVLKNGIDTSLFKPISTYRTITRQKYNLQDDTVAICYVGRLVELKGVMHLMKAVMELNQNLNFKLFIVGALSGGFKDNQSETTSFVKELQILGATISDKVLFTGYIENSKLPVFLNGMDVAVMPSKYKEAAAVNNIEYQAIGLPVVTTNMGGIKEYVSTDSVFIVENDDHLTESLKEKIEILVTDKDTRETMGANGISWVKQYSKEHYFDSLLDLLQRLI